MTRRLGYGSLLVAVLLALAAAVVQRSTAAWVEVQGVPLDPVLVAGRGAGAVAAAAYGLHRIVLRLLVERVGTKRRKHDTRQGTDGLYQPGPTSRESRATTIRSPADTVDRPGPVPTGPDPATNAFPLASPGD